MTNQYILYGTSACHLCEEAEAIIKLAEEESHNPYIFKDIVDDDDLMQEFGLIIPVLKCPATNEQLNWPFNKDELITFFNRQ